MSNIAHRVTPVECKILKSLQQKSPANVVDITVNIYGENNRTNYAYVHKSLGRLQKKGYVEKDSSNRPQLYSPRVSYNEVIIQELTDLAGKYCNGSMEELVGVLTEEAD